MMILVFVVLAVAAALFLPRPRVLIAVGLAWAACVVFVGWGPAHSSGVHTASAGFWVPWVILGAIGSLLALGISWLRARRAGRRLAGAA